MSIQIFWTSDMNNLIFCNSGEPNLKVCGTLKNFSCNIGVQIRTVPKLFCRQFFLQQKKMLKGKHDVLFHNGSRELKVLEQVVWAEVMLLQQKLLYCKICLIGYQIIITAFLWDHKLVSAIIDAKLIHYN